MIVTVSISTRYITWYELRLLAGTDLPSTSKGFRDFRVGNHSTSIRIREPLLNRPHDVEVVEDVVKTAIVGQAIQELTNLLLGFQLHHLDLTQGSYAMSGMVPPEVEHGPTAQRAKATSESINAVSQAIE